MTNEFKPDWDMPEPAIEALRENMELLAECKSLIDGAFEVVELWKADTPSQRVWKRDWLIKASRIVPQGPVTERLP